MKLDVSKQHKLFLSLLFLPQNHNNKWDLCSTGTRI